MKSVCLLNRDREYCGRGAVDIRQQMHAQAEAWRVDRNEGAHGHGIASAADFACRCGSRVKTGIGRIDRNGLWIRVGAAIDAGRPGITAGRRVHRADRIRVGREQA